MNKEFKNIYYRDNVGNKDYVGNIELFDDKLVFSDDSNSCNHGNCTIKILFIDISVEEQIKEMKRVNPMSQLIIKTKNNEYNFDFQYKDDYEKVFSFILEQIK